MTSNSSRTAPKIIVDADSCPVKDIILQAAAESAMPVILVASLAHRIESQQEGVQVIPVDNIPQAADIAIINNVGAGDIVVTGDYGLAAMVLGKGGRPLSPRGFSYTADNIDRLLEQRFVEARIRRGGGRTKGPKAFTDRDRQRFAGVLKMLIAGQAVDTD